MLRLEFSFLGASHVALDGHQLEFPSVKTRALLAYLVLEAGRIHHRRHLAGLFWPETTEQNALHNLRQSLYQLRKQLDNDAAHPPFLTVTRSAVTFNPESCYRLDVEEFLRLTERGRHAQAVDLYRGPLLMDFLADVGIEFDEWLLVQREQLHRRVLNALQSLIDQCRADGAFERMEHFARRQLSLDPYHEGTHRSLMFALAMQGRRGAALAQYEACRRLLADELGAAPTTETAGLYEQIKTGAVGPRVALPQVGAKPTFGEGVPFPPHNLPAQATPFIGRERELAHVERALLYSDRRLLTLVGPAGIGKTRLALAAAWQRVYSASAFPDGVFFVPLAGDDGSILEPAAFTTDRRQPLVHAILRSLDRPHDPRITAREVLFRYLRPRQLLLILDGWTRHLDDAAVLADLLGAAPGVRLLVTATTPVGIADEDVLHLRGLLLPEIGTSAAPETYPSVALFVQCARQARPGFRLTDENHQAIVDICRAVRGSPLGIELAAGRVRWLPCSAIAMELWRHVRPSDDAILDVPLLYRRLQAGPGPVWAAPGGDDRLRTIGGPLQDRKYRHLFDVIDSNKDGYVEASDFTRYTARFARLRDLGAEAPAYKQIAEDNQEWWDTLRRFARKTAKGRVTLDEWFAFWSTWQVRVISAINDGQQAALERVVHSAAIKIEALDTDCDGRINVDEYGTFLKAWRIPADPGFLFDYLGRTTDDLISRDELIRCTKDFWLTNDPSAPGNHLFGRLF